MSQMRLAVEGNTKSGVVVDTNQKIDVARLGAGLLQQTAHGLGAHMRGAEALALEDMPLLDSGALGNPLVGVSTIRASSSLVCPSAN